MNKINLQDINVTYQATSRISVTLTVPILFASRRSNNAFSTTHSAGLGDMAVVAQGWLWNPRHAKRGNISIGLGVQAPTGKDNVQNNLLTSATATTPTLTTVDYSIQPGSGGWGMIFQWQAFRELGHSTTVYTNGSYVATQGGTNNVLRSATALSQPLTAYNAIQDQYLLQAGVSHPIPAIKGLTLKFGPRMEGVPAANLIGNDLGFRRPGFAISAEPGVIYARGRQHDRGQHRKGGVPQSHAERSGQDSRHARRRRIRRLRLAVELQLPPACQGAHGEVMRLATLTALLAALALCADAPKADLTLQDANGQKVRLRDLRGKPVVLNFWATWCGPCNAEMPMLVEMEKQYAARGVLFIGASLDEAKTKAQDPGISGRTQGDVPGLVRRHRGRSRQTQTGQRRAGDCVSRCRGPHCGAHSGSGPPRGSEGAAGLVDRRQVRHAPAAPGEAS